MSQDSYLLTYVSVPGLGTLAALQDPIGRIVHTATSEEDTAS